jgi:hypothetical protein
MLNFKEKEKCSVCFFIASQCTLHVALLVAVYVKTAGSAVTNCKTQ